MKQLQFKITGMHCTSCAINIDGELEDLKGVTEARTDYIKQVSFVTLNSEQIQPATILKTIQKLGYDAELVSS